MPQVNVIENIIEGGGAVAQYGTIPSGSTLALLRGGYSISNPTIWYDTINNKSASVVGTSALQTSSVLGISPTGWIFNGTDNYLKIGSSSLAGMVQATEVTIVMSVVENITDSLADQIQGQMAYWGNPSVLAAAGADLNTGNKYADMVVSASDGSGIESYAFRNPYWAPDLPSPTNVIAITTTGTPSYGNNNVIKTIGIRYGQSGYNPTGDPQNYNRTTDMVNSITINKTTYSSSFNYPSNPDWSRFGIFDSLNNADSASQPGLCATYFGLSQDLDSNLPIDQPKYAANFSGSVAGILIYSRSLSDDELHQAGLALANLKTNPFTGSAYIP